MKSFTAEMIIHKMAYIDATSLFVRTNIKVQKKNIFQWDETNKSRLLGGLQKTNI